MPRTYVNNASNRSLGRVGMSVGSMPVSRGATGGGGGSRGGGGSSSSGGSAYSGSSHSSNTYVDNAYNRSHDRVGMPKGSMVISKSESGGSGQPAPRAPSPKTYVDNAYNRSHGRAGMPVGSMVIPKSSKSDTGNQNVFQTKSATAQQQYGDRQQPDSGIRVYKDNPLNRQLGRVGKPLGTMVHSSKTKSVTPKVYKDTKLNQELERVGLPLGSRPSKKKSSTTEKIKEIFKMIEKEDEVEEINPDSRSEYYQEYDDSMAEAFEQAMCRLNRLQEEMSWKEVAQSDEPPRTTTSVLTDYQGKKIPFTDLKLGRKIGRGGFGEVYFAEWKETVVAVKKLQEDKISNKRLKEFAEEVMTFCMLDHANIVKFIGACVERPDLCIVMEYMQMSLYDALHISDEVDFTDKERLDIIRQTCDGLKYLHSGGIAHCDLKTANVLLNIIPGKIEVKITDFGLSMIKSNTLTSSSFTSEMVSNIGTPRYSAPELLCGEMLSAKDMMKADTYSLSLLLFEVVFEDEPFYNYSYPQLQKLVGKEGAKPDVPERHAIDSNVMSIMQRAWSFKPEDRPNISEICDVFMPLETIHVL